MKKAEKNLATISAYYEAITNKSPQLAAEHLGEEVKLVTPLAEVSGKGAVVGAIIGFSEAIDGINFKAKLSNDSQVMLAYEIIFPRPIGAVRAAGLFTLKDDKIQNIELYYDSQSMESKKDEIFNNQ